jgi:hypothetical protein
VNISKSGELTLIDEICDEVRVHILHRVDEFLESAKQNRESDPRSYERAIQIRKGCDDLPMNSRELDELMTSIRTRAIVNIALLELSGVVAVGSTDNYTNRVGMRKIPPRTMYVSATGGDINEIAQTIFDNIWYYNTWGNTIGDAIDEDGDEVLVRFDYKEYVPQSAKGVQ